MNGFLYDFLMILVLSSCVSGKEQMMKEDFEVMHTIDYAQSFPSEMKLSSLCNSVELIPLDTIGNFYVGNIKCLKYACQHIFVLDDTETLYVFDRQGKGRTAIRRKGKGRNEYIDVRGFDLTSDSLVCLLTYPAKLMYFTLDGDFVKEYALDTKGFELALLPDDKAVVYTDNVNSTPKEASTLVDICNLSEGNSEGHILGYICFPHRMLPTYQQNRVFVETVTDECLFSEPLSNRIFGIVSDSVYVKYNIDFGRRNPDKCLPESMNPNSSVSVLDFVQENIPVYGFNSCWENSSYLYVQFYEQGRPRSLLYDRRSDKTYVGNVLQDDLTGCNPRFLKATDECLVGYWTAEDILSLGDYLENMNKGMTPDFRRMLDVIKVKENPVLGLFHFIR